MYVVCCRCCFCWFCADTRCDVSVAADWQLFSARCTVPFPRAFSLASLTASLCLRTLIFCCRETLLFVIYGVSYIRSIISLTCCRHSLHDNKKVCVNRRASFRSASRNIREIVLMVTDLPQGSRALCLWSAAGVLGVFLMIACTSMSGWAYWCGPSGRLGLLRLSGSWYYCSSI